MSRLKQLIDSGWQLEGLINQSKEETFDFNEQDKNGADPLYWALDSGKEDIALWLLENGANSNANAVYASAQHGCLDVFNILLERKAPFDEPFEVGKFTPLLAAVSEAAFSIRLNLKVTKTVGGKEVEVTDPAEIEKTAGRNKYDDYLQIIRTLLEKGADKNYCEPKNKQSPLIFVGDRGGSEVASLLLTAGSEINVKDKFGMTPLHWACRKGHQDVVKLFIEAGANLNAQEEFGFTPLHEAAENNHQAIVEKLLESGADKKIGLLKNFDHYKVGNTPFDVATIKKHQSLLELLKV